MNSVETGPGKDRSNVDHVDDFDLQAAIWILSSLDENPVMTYRGIVDRIGSTEEKVRRLVLRRRELFRTGVPRARLDLWKTDMSRGSRIPNWIREQQNPSQAIEDLTTDDVFRNQFRIEEKAKKSDLEIIEWGLQHIERLRKADSEHRQDAKARWSLVLTGLSVLVAFGTMLATIFLQGGQVGYGPKTNMVRYRSVVRGCRLFR